MMPLWAMFYISIVFFSGTFSMAKYRSRGVLFLVGEGFSLLFTVVIFLYYYHLYPKPSSYLVVICMFLYVVYWEFIEIVKIAEEEFQNENITNKDGEFLKIIILAFFAPFFYITSLLLKSYF